MNAQPIITQHALQRAAERRNWKDASTARGQIAAAFKRGIRVGRFNSRKHNGATELIVDRTTRTVLAYTPAGNMIKTLMTPELLTVAFDLFGDEITRLHEERLAALDAERAVQAAQLASKRDEFEYEAQYLDDKIIALQAKLNAYMARRNALDVTLAEYEADVDAVDDTQRRVVRSLAAVKLS